MALKTFSEHLLSLSPRWLTAFWSERFAGTVLGYVHDAIATGTTDSLRIGWVKDSEVPVDGLPHLGRNFGLPAYAIETPPQHIERMSTAWDLWSRGGDEWSIESQLATLGLPGVVYTPDEWSRSPENYWSQAWLFFPEGTHPVTSQGPICGIGVCGVGGLICGPVGITTDQLRTIRQVIAQWKPHDWIFREIIFEITSPTCGADGAAGGGAICGGVTAVTGAG